MPSERHSYSRSRSPAPRRRDRDRDGDTGSQRDGGRHRYQERSRHNEDEHRVKRSRWEDEEDKYPATSKDEKRSRRRDGSEEQASRRDKEREDNRSRDSRDSRRQRDHEAERRKDDNEDRHRKQPRREERERSKDRHKDRKRDKSLEKRRPRSKSRSHSPSTDRRRRNRSHDRDSRNPSNPPDDPDAPPPVEKEKPNYSVTKHLISETNTLGLKYAEPPDARLPPSSQKWQLFVFKGNDVVDTIPLGGRTCWLFGRDGNVVDVKTEHPSCSGQHAVLQFRFRSVVDEWGERRGSVKPYIIDLESANGTWLNKVKLEGARHVELQERDLIKFGHSTRDYILMLDKSGGK